MYTKFIEVHGQRGKQAKLQSKLAADALHGGQAILDEMVESEDSTEDASLSASSASSVTTTPRGLGNNGNLSARGASAGNGSSLRSSIRSHSSVESPDAEQQMAYFGSKGPTITSSSEMKRGWRHGVKGGSAEIQVKPETEWHANPVDPTQSYQSNYGGNVHQSSRSMNYAPSMYQSHPMSGMSGATNYRQQQQMHHASDSGSLSHHHDYSQHAPSQYQQNTTAHLQSPYPLQNSITGAYSSDIKSEISSESYQIGSNAHGTNSFPAFSPNPGMSASFNSAYESYPHMASSPNSSDMMMMTMNDPTPEGSTFAYNDMGQYGSASHMKYQDADMNYIQPDAVYYPIPPACSDDMVQSFFSESPSSPSADSSTDGSPAMVHSGYPFLSRLIPNSTHEVVSLGQECCLIGQNFVYNDSDANSIWFTLQTNKAKVKAPIQRSTSNSHIATIPPLSYFGVSYAAEPLMAIVELYQYSLLVPCEQQFHYLSTSGQLNNLSSRVTVRDPSNGPSSKSFTSSSSGTISFSDSQSSNRDVDAQSAYFNAAGNTAYSTGVPSSGGPVLPAAATFFFNTGVPSINTLTVDNNLEAIEALVESGADVNQSDLWGITPLHLAIFFGRRDIANYLLRLGVEKSVQTEDINGDTPLDLVIRHWNPEIRGLYDVMVSLLHDPSQTVSTGNEGSSVQSITSRRAASANALQLPHKPSFTPKKGLQTSIIKTLSSEVPFEITGDTLKVLRPEFWSDLQLALEKIAAVSASSNTSSNTSHIDSSTAYNSEEEKMAIDKWSQIEKVKNVISSDLSLTDFPSIPVLAFPVLERLDFSGNSLRFLPNDWSKFKTLSSLDVSRNLIDILPGSLALHPKLSSFSYKDNPLRLVPSALTSSVLSRNVMTSASNSPSPSSAKDAPPGNQKLVTAESSWNRSALFQYLRDISSGSDHVISDSKVRINILGERYVERRLLQKTLQVDFSSFVTRLRYKVPNITPSDEIAVEDVMEKSSSSDISFETWTAGARHTDFASQVLITPALGIQVVQFSLLRPDLKEIHYWLQAVFSRAPTSPVVIVACHSEALNTNREAASVLLRVGAMATSLLSSSVFNAEDDVVPISFANGDGIDALKRRFSEHASRHGLTNKSFPKPIAQLMQAIHTIKESRWFLSKRELCELALQFGIEVSDGPFSSSSSESSQASTSSAPLRPKFASLVQQLSALGGLVHFSIDDEHPTSHRLSDVVFTDPQRLCHALTNFPMRHKRLIKDGILHLRDCDPQFVSILNGLPPIESSSSSSASTPPQSSTPPPSPSTTAPRSGKQSQGSQQKASQSSSSKRPPSPRSNSPPGNNALLISTGSPPSEPSALEAPLSDLSLRPSMRNSKGFLTSPLKSPARPSACATPSPFIGRPRIDDRVLVDLLVLFGEAVRISNEEDGGVVLLPRLLPESVSDDLLLQYWSQGLSHSFERVYHFIGPSVPKLFCNGLLAELYSDSRLEVCLHWAHGLVLRHGSERARISYPAPNVLHMHVSGEMPSMLLPMMVEVIEVSISAFAPSNALAQVLIPSASLSSASMTLRLEEVLQALCDGETQIARGQTILKIGQVAPDLCLLGMQPLEVEEEALSTRSDTSVNDALYVAIQNSATNSANTSASSPSSPTTSSPTLEHPDLLYTSGELKTVWNGTIRGTQDVQIAYYHKPVNVASYRSKTEYMVALFSSYATGLRACTAEARLLNTIQHPNIVTVKAFNLSEQVLATESSPHGTLRNLLQRAATNALSEPFTPELKLRMMLELAQAVAWMHSNHIAHGALTPDAVLVTSLDVNPQHVHIKIGNLHCARRLFTCTPARTCAAQRKDVRDLASIFAQIWAVNDSNANATTTASNTSNIASSDHTNAVGANNSETSSASHVHLDNEVSELIASCSQSANASHSFGTTEIMQHLEYLFAVNNWMLSASHWRNVSSGMSSVASPVHSYWTLDKSARFLEFNDREIASISSIVTASNGHIWVATASGYVHVWNPSAPDDAARTVIQTYSIDTRQSRRRINALMTSGAYVWCITDGSICVYSNDGQLVKSITHKQSLCLAKYSSPTNASSQQALVYIGGAHGEISVWDSNTFQCALGVVLENRLPITAIAVDSRYLWIGVGVSRRVSHIVVLNKRTLNEIYRFQAHDDLISSIVVIDDAHIWTSSFDGKINIWNFTAESDKKVSVRLEKSIMTHRRAILKMTAGARSNDGSVSKVFTSDNSGIFVWDTKHNQLIDKHIVGRHRGAIGALESADFNSFLSASVEDGCVCLWKRGQHSQ